MTYLEKVIRKLNKYFKNKKIYKKLEISILKTPLQIQVAFKKMLLKKW